jgi:hypothetical protein
MEANSFSVFKKYSSFEQAKIISTILKEQGIEVHFTDNIPQVDGNLLGTAYGVDYEIKIKPSDFEKAEKILSEDAENYLNQMDKDHYIFSFTDEELYEIILKPDEWNEMDYLMAKKLLEKKGKPVDESMIHTIKKQRIADLAQPEENQKAWIYAGYAAAILGGFLGIIIGYVLTTSKKTLPNGERVYSYSEKDRASGKTILYLSLVFFPIYLLLRIFLTK